MLGASSTNAQPERVGPYQIVRELGRGGMGVVYEVRHPQSPQRLALKLMLNASDNPHGLSRFQREVGMLMRLQHPSLLRIYDQGQSPVGPYMVTELVEGQPLEQRLERGALPPEEAARVVAAVAGAVHHMHGHGILHRDLKPDNVMLRHDGTPVLLDLGVAKDLAQHNLTQTGAIVGTPAFMAPEQVEDSRGVDERADVYGLGATLYYSLTGDLPHDGESQAALLKQILFDEVTPLDRVDPSIPEALSAICQMAMAKEPRQRYPSAEAFQRELEAFADAKEVGALGEMRAQRRRALARRALLSASVTLALVAVGLGVRHLLRSPTSGETPDAPTEAPTPEEVGSTRTLAQTLPPLHSPRFGQEALRALREDPADVAEIEDLLEAWEELERLRGLSPGRARDDARAAWWIAHRNLPASTLGACPLEFGPTSAWLHGAPVDPNPENLRRFMEAQTTFGAFLNPAGTQLVTANISEVVVWELPEVGQAPQRVASARLRPGIDEIHRMAVAANGELVAMALQLEVPGSDAPGLALFFPRSQRLAQIEVPGRDMGASRATAVAVSAHAERVAVGNTRGQVHLYRFRGEAAREDGFFLTDFGDDTHVRGLAFATGERLFTLNGDNGRDDTGLRCWDLTAVPAPAPIGEPLQFGKPAPGALWVAEDGARAWIGRWAGSGELVAARMLSGSLVRDRAVHPSGAFTQAACTGVEPIAGTSWLAVTRGWGEFYLDRLDHPSLREPSARFPGGLELWDLELDAQIATILSPEGDAVQSLDVSADGRRILVTTHLGRIEVRGR